MNIVTQFPVNLNLNLANPHTEEARKEALSRQAISEAAENEQSPSQSGTGADQEKNLKRGLQQSLTYDFSRQELNKQAAANYDVTNPNSELNDASAQQDATQDQENRGQSFTQQNAEPSDKITPEQQQEDQELDDLKQRDQEVRIHEQAHANTGGQYAGSPQYEFERGPDGKNYAVEGEVKIDVSPVSGDPQATIEKMDQVKRAALAPAEPSSADRKVANEAAQTAQEARAELIQAQSNNETVDPEQNINAAPSTVNTVPFAEPDIQTQTTPSVADVFQNTQTEQASIPKFEPKQTLAQNSDQASLNIEQRDQNINARALKIERFYQQSSAPSELSFTRYA
ncbi:putative metalloprotease CJM1_0395 family protein [Catenovulum adriaticum]|uniref:Metalloprotease CJM1_0395 family protein n=1 Tax=Catenovulum adriaticum TaxID=2984846 RepID=A0ABY7AP13_9ALTE|nr:putative metalloprotease CJM1_0395 family protein [Catenovulum sp. TS8]WAJ70016.1 putative metalloprotease CJM1_0395 family protein [Catenovulum sp. TS8]